MSSHGSVLCSAANWKVATGLQTRVTAGRKKWNTQSWARARDAGIDESLGRQMPFPEQLWQSKLGWGGEKGSEKRRKEVRKKYTCGNSVYCCWMQGETVPLGYLFHPFFVLNTVFTPTKNRIVFANTPANNMYLLIMLWRHLYCNRSVVIRNRRRLSVRHMITLDCFA